MSDFTICLNDMCPMQKKCKRQQKRETYSFQDFAYFNEEHLHECDHFIPLDEDLCQKKN